MAMSLQRVYYDKQVGSISQSLYSDGQWHTTATVPAEVKLMEFQDVESALKLAREDAASKGLAELALSECSSAPQFEPNLQNGGHRLGVRPRL